MKTKITAVENFPLQSQLVCAVEHIISQEGIVLQRPGSKSCGAQQLTYCKQHKGKPDLILPRLEPLTYQTVYTNMHVLNFKHQTRAKMQEEARSTLTKTKMLRKLAYINVDLKCSEATVNL